MLYLLYPIILGMIPVHTLYAQNLSEISKESYLKVSVSIITIIVLGYSLLYLINRDISLSALLSCINFFLLLYANYFYIGMFSSYNRKLNAHRKIFAISYITICIIFSLILYIALKEVSLDCFNKIAFYISVTLTLFIFLDIHNKSEISKQAINTQLDSTNLKNERSYISNFFKPDIYHIILDAHDGFSYPETCDKEFKKALEDRGFHIYENYRANYNYTSLSLPSMFNMDYIHNLIKNQNSYNRAITYPLYAKNFVFNEFKELGYNCNLYINKMCQHIFSKENQNTKINIDIELKKLLSFSSIIHIIFSENYYRYPNDFTDMLDIYSKFKNDEVPNYRFMHLMAPHRPYYFDEFGNKLPQSEHINNKNYFSYMKYVDKHIISLIDKIKSKMKENSIILLHSDHPYNRGKEFNILCAAYFPERDDYKCIEENGTLVNLFRYIFNKKLLTNYKILDDKFYLCNYLGDILAEVKDTDIIKTQV